MSATIDEKVVEMQFDNQNFERNVQTSLSTLEKLKQSLKLEDSAKSFEKIDKAANSISLDGIASGIESLQNRFSTMGIIGMTVLQNLTNSALNFAKNTMSQVTDSIIGGGKRRAFNIENAHFQLQGLLGDEEQVQAIMNDAMDSVDGTAYAYDEAAKAASQFAASGMRSGEKMQSALRGITGVAAMTNSEYEGISKIFTTVSGNGRLMGDQLLQLSSRGLNAAATITDYLNGVKNGSIEASDTVKSVVQSISTATDLTEGDIRDLVSKGQISFEIFSSAMDNAFGEHAKKANDTFTGAMSNIKAALARIGADFISPLIVQNGALVKMFNALRVKVNEVRSSVAPLAKVFTNTVIKAAEIATEYIEKLDFSKFFDGFNKSVTALGQGLGVIDKTISAKDLLKLKKQSEETGVPLIQLLKALDEKPSGLSLIIDSIGNALKGLRKIFGTITGAFQEIFPPKTAEQIRSITEGINEFSKKLIISDETASKLTRVFKGVFAVFDIVGQAIGALTRGVFGFAEANSSIGGGFLEIIAKIGDRIVDLDNFIRKSELFNTAASGIRKALQIASDAIKKFFASIGLIDGEGNEDGPMSKVFNTKGIDAFADKVKERFSPLKGIVNGVSAIFKGLWTIVKALTPVFSALATAFGNTLENIGNAISDALTGKGDFSGVLDLVNGGIFAAIGVGLTKLINNFNKIAGIANGELKRSSGISALLNRIKSSLTMWQNELKAGILLKIAAAIGIISLSLVALSLIDSGKLTVALAAITAAFGEFLGFMMVFEKTMGDSNFRGMNRAGKAMIKIAAAVLILSFAIKNLASLEWDGLAKGLIGVAALSAILTVSAKELSKSSGKLIKGSLGLISFALAIRLLVKPVKELGALDLETTGKGLLAIGVLCAELATFTKITSGTKGMITTATGMLIISAAMLVFSKAITTMGNFSWEQIGKGLITMAGALLIIGLALNAIPATAPIIAVGMVLVGAALKIIASVLKDVGGFSWENLAKGLIAIGGALGIIALATLAMRKSLKGAVAITVVAASLAILAPILKVLGSMTIAEIGTALIALAGAFTIIGVAGLVLRPIIPAILGLAGAITLLGIGALACGVGVLALSAGLTALAISGGAGITALVLALEAIISLIPQFFKMVGQGVVEFFKAIANSASALSEAFTVIIRVAISTLSETMPELVEALLSFIDQTLASLVDHLPSIVSSIMAILIAVLEGIRDNIGEITSLGVDIFIGFIESLIEELTKKAPQLQEAIKSADSISILLLSLTAACVILGKFGSISGSAKGALSIGIFIGILGSILAVLGELVNFIGENRIAEDLDSSIVVIGKIGEAIGSLIGGIVGGAIGTGAEVISSKLPKIGTHLSSFVENASLFFDKTKDFDGDGIESLANALLKITAADLLDSITNWVSGESSLSKFAKELVPFGVAFRTYASIIKGVDSDVVVASSAAAESIMEFAKKAPNEGGLVSYITGDNSLGDFAKELVPFGFAFRIYANAIKGIDASAVEGTSIAVESILEFAKKVPNEGGLVSYITGDNSLGDFAKGLIPFGIAFKVYSSLIKDVDVKTLLGTSNAASALTELAATIPNTGGIFSIFTGDNSLDKFGKDLSKFGKALSEYSTSIKEVSVGKITRVTAAVQAIVTVRDLMATGEGSSGGWFSQSTFTEFTNDLVNGAYNLTQLDEIDQSTVKNFTDGISGILKAFDNMTVPKATAIKMFSESMNTLAGTDINSAISSISNSDNVSAMTSSMDTLLGGVSDSIDNASFDFTSMVAQMSKDLQSNSNVLLFGGVGQSFAKALTLGFSSITSEFVTTAVTAVRGAAAFMKLQYQEFYGAGAHLVTGFVNGIDNNIFRVKIKAIAMAQAAIDAARKTLNEHSPSKVFYKIGDYAGLGFVNALQDYASVAYSVASDMGNSARRGLGDAISRVAEFLDSGVDPQPTIRPVLDLSSVEDGVGAIGDMLSIRHPVGLLANVNGINMAMSDRRSTTSNDDVVSAINGLRKELGKVKGDTYQVGDVTYDDGSNVSGAVESLIRAVRVKRRA